jgi:hypothetical protein
MRRIFATLFACLSLEVSVSAAPDKKLSAPQKGVPFILDSNRILLDVVFTTPDGHERGALAWFNMGIRRLS